MLSTQEKKRKSDLLSKFKNKSINMEEAQELKIILEKERQKAVSLGDIVAVIIIGILLAAVISIIFSDEQGDED